jgi:hypothetical protein
VNNVHKRVTFDALRYFLIGDAYFSEEVDLRQYYYTTIFRSHLHFLVMHHKDLHSGQMMIHNADAHENIPIQCAES